MRRLAPLLAEAAPLIAHAAIRNRGTIGGSLAHADPAAELAMLALLLDAEIVSESQRGARVLPAKAFLVGALLACLFFGFAEAVAIRMQGTVDIPNQFIQMIPYVLTMVVLAGWIGRSRPEFCGMYS